MLPQVALNLRRLAVFCKRTEKKKKTNTISVEVLHVAHGVTATKHYARTYKLTDRYSSSPSREGGVSRRYTRYKADARARSRGWKGSRDDRNVPVFVDLERTENSPVVGQTHLFRVQFIIFPSERRPQTGLITFLPADRKIPAANCFLHGRAAATARSHKSVDRNACSRTKKDVVGELGIPLLALAVE